jgi:hypothetical protein
MLSPKSITLGEGSVSRSGRVRVGGCVELAHDRSRADSLRWCGSQQACASDNVGELVVRSSPWSVTESSSDVTAVDDGELG